ncbi:FMN-dependent NADH-azoreductase [Rhizobium sp. ICMP 5592]|uniref:FMN-dependent NADH-azoreductase n=1 Tax=Rhizobium sp. ICMP 5592 TaxID=2292445 RepID=UPI0012967945|nr:FMN-dependent NADH-azoreductase [Rhizobium sp. ICMP 5592]MQB46142.1 FMN-dependent NADH-azoreductase [Rhizobium sp. ICMP 5592]
MKILHIDSSISGAQSVSRQLGASVIARLKEAAPDHTVVYRDLAAAPVPHQSPSLQFAKLKVMYEAGVLSGGVGDMVATAIQAGATVDPTTEAELSVLDGVLDEFLAADVVVIGAPMYNFSIPSQLKAWIDCLAVPGKTFAYTATGVEGLCGGKKLIVASSRGGFYTVGSPMASMDHQEAFLKSYFGFVGITDMSFVRAEGVNIGPEQREQAIASALSEIATLKAA